MQANHGWRERLTVAGAPVGRVIGTDVVPDPYDDLPDSAAGAGSIIVIVATDAPLLPHQCRRIAQRASFGIARTLLRASEELPKPGGERLREFADARIPSLKFQLLSDEPIYEDLDRAKRSLRNADA